MSQTHTGDDIFRTAFSFRSCGSVYWQAGMPRKPDGHRKDCIICGTTLTCIKPLLLMTTHMLLRPTLPTVRVTLAWPHKCNTYLLLALQWIHCGHFKVEILVQKLIFFCWTCIFYFLKQIPGRCTWYWSKYSIKSILTFSLAHKFYLLQF